MRIRCVRNWLYHDWGTDGRCTRGCGSTFRGTPLASTSVDDPSLSEVLAPARLVDPADPHGSHHHRHSQADDSSFAVFAGDLVCSEEL